MSNRRKPKFGQNFLVDDHARHRIADALGPITDRLVIEIGPGHGAITDILAARAGRLLAIELDPTLAADLAHRYRDRPTVQVLQADILATDLTTLIPPGQTADVLGNLPYYITSDILLHLFAAGARGLLRQAVVMIQREVADRVAASPGNRDYGMLSATAALNASVDSLFTLPPTAFQPAPDVHSTVLRLHFHPRYTELALDPVPFTRFLRAIFAQKRKTLSNNLRAAGYPPHAITAAWPPNLDGNVRAEALPIETTAALFRALTDGAPLPSPLRPG